MVVTVLGRMCSSRASCPGRAPGCSASAESSSSWATARELPGLATRAPRRSARRSLAMPSASPSARASPLLPVPSGPGAGAVTGRPAQRRYPARRRDRRHHARVVCRDIRAQADAEQGQPEHHHSSGQRDGQRSGAATGQDSAEGAGDRGDTCADRRLANRAGGSWARQAAIAHTRPPGHLDRTAQTCRARLHRPRSWSGHPGRSTRRPPRGAGGR